MSSIHDKQPTVVSSDATPISEEEFNKYLDRLADDMNQAIVKYIQVYEDEFIEKPAKIRLTGDPFIPIQYLNSYAGHGRYLPSVVYGGIQTDTKRGYNLDLLNFQASHSIWVNHLMSNLKLL
jgi:hypothetical protein